MTESVKILIIDKTATIKELKVKKFSEEDLYKKCGLTQNKDFEKQTTWNVSLKGNTYNISLYAKKEGRAGQENKYDYPPPVDKELYFGSNALVYFDDNGVPQDLTKKQWEKIYEHLFGGFEDLDGSEEESTDETDAYNELEKTKSGYAKDNFVVDDADDDYDCESELDEEEYI
jgi:hypothetical protein